MLTETRARILAEYARDRRGWDIAGCLAQLKRVAHIDADRTSLAWVRFCADAKTSTPGAFPNIDGPHWVERVKPGGGAVHPPKAADACPLCNRHRDLCICTPDERPQEALGGVWRPSEPASPERIAVLAAQARAELHRHRDEEGT